MNSTQAKKIKLIDIMDRLGFEVKAIERGGQEHKYLSPFRHEKEPSFNVNLVKNAWFDFGLGKGGNALDFALEYVQHTGTGFSVRDALFWLERLQGRGVVKKVTTKPLLKDDYENVLELVRVSDVKSKVILSYLTEIRKIAPELVHKYVKQVRYKNNKEDKIYFAYGIENILGGYEIRVATDDYEFRSAINGKSISYIKGFRPDNGIVNVFEGTTDFLSLLTMLKTTNLLGDSIIMHSLTSYKQTLKLIGEKEYKSVNLFLDNDDAGRDHTAAFERDLVDLRVDDQAKSFMPHKDINAALVAQFTPTF